MKNIIPKYGSIEWGIHQYEQRKLANKGHNYRYFDEKWWKEMEVKGWQMLKIKDRFEGDVPYTSSELFAKEEVERLRKEGNHARIIAGYHQIVQKIKYFTIIYKKKP